MNTNISDDINKPLDTEQKRRGRPPKKLHWQQIERYWEEQKLKKNLEDVFFQATDHEMLK